MVEQMWLAIIDEAAVAPESDSEINRGTDVLSRPLPSHP